MSKQLWEQFKDTEVHSWFDYSESGNKQVTIVYSLTPPTDKGKKTLLPCEPGSLLPPFLIQMQKDAAAAVHGQASGPPRGSRQRSAAK